MICRLSLTACTVATGICVMSATAQTLQVRVVTARNQSHACVQTQAVVPVFIQVQLSGAPTDGLALIGLDLKATGSLLPFDLCDQTKFLLTAPTTPVDIKGHFDRNAGLTNPPAAPSSGFSGTCDGAKGLLQIGGAQNTIGNTGTPVSYPTGSVLEGVGNSGYVTIASGSFTASAIGSGMITLSLDKVFAAVLDAGQTGPVYQVSRVPPENINITGPLTLIVGAGIPTCPDADVDCDGAVNGGDILAVRAPGTWNTTNQGRADVNRDGVVNGSDILAIRAPGTWNTTSGPCCCGL